MSVSEAAFTDKMERLNASAQSIETTSSWCCLWRGEAQHIVSWWENYFVKTTQPKRLNMLYLANDILQNSRKRGPEFVDHFYRIMPRALHLVYSKGDEKTRNSVRKVVNVWGERRVFGASGVKAMQSALEESTSRPSNNNAGGGTTTTGNHVSAAIDPRRAAQATSTSAGGVLTGFTAAPQLNELARHLQKTDELAAAATSSLTHFVTIKATADVATSRPVLQEAITSIHQEGAARKQAIEVLRQLLAMQEEAVEQASVKLSSCHTQLQELDGGNAAAGVATEGGEEVEQGNGNDDEAAAVAAQLVNNPGALFEALASMPTSQQEQAAQGTGGDDDEYDPEDAF